MKKILLILGVFLTLANDASSSGISQPISPESDNIIPSPYKKDEEGSETLGSMFAQNKLGDSGEWFLGNGKPLLPSENTKAPKTFNYPERVKKNNPQKNLEKSKKKFSVSRNLFRILQKSILWDLKGSTEVTWVILRLVRCWKSLTMFLN